MAAVALAGRAVTGAIGLLELLVLALSSRTPARREIGHLAAQILIVSCGVYLPPVVELRAVFLLVLVWSTGLHASALAGPGNWSRRLPAWHAAVGGSLLGLGLLRLIVGPALLPLLLLLCFLAGVLAVLAVGLLAKLAKLAGSRRTQRVLLPYALLCAALLVAHGWEVLSAGALLPAVQAALPVTVIYLGTLFVWLARRPQADFSGLLHVRPGSQEQRLRQAYARIVQTEHSLLVQDRLVAAGVLAAGAAHEFKNTLASILATVDHGLRSGGARAAECLQLTREHALQGQRAVTELLEGLVRHGRERPERFLVLQALSPLLEIVRAASRREGIQFLVEIPEALEVTSRKGELEQVLLSLIRNAADSVRAHPAGAEEVGQIALRGRRLEEAVIIDVVDSGGGVPKALEGRLFELAVSDKGSTGVGLYLAATLAERNGGSLSYFPVQAGSCFRLALPVA